MPAVVCFLLSLIAFSAFGCNVLIYNDDGVDKLSLKWIYNFFKSRGDHIKVVNANFLIENRDWIFQYQKLVIPGGADCPYHKKLKGVGCQNIKDFVFQGGTYIGICAGGYFGCKKVEFALGTDLEVNEDRELAFFPGIAKGPMLKPYTYDSEKGASAALIRSSLDGSCFYTYHNGGSTFILEGVNCSNINVLAEYVAAENSPAIIECKYGKGKAILSGVHYEVDSKCLLATKEDLEIIKPIADKIESTSKLREKFLSSRL